MIRVNPLVKPGAKEAFWVAVAILVVRLVYLLTVSPYELVSDEAQYWEWSRRLSLSYYTKGPGIAWAIAASTRLLGAHVWSVKLPAVVASFVLMLAALGLGRRIGRGRSSAAWYAVLAVALMPGYVGTALLATTDGPYTALWLVAVLCVWIAVEPGVDRPTTHRLAGWAGAGAALGTAALFKYTALLLVPGVLLYLWLRLILRPSRETPPLDDTSPSGSPDTPHDAPPHSGHAAGRATAWGLLLAGVTATVTFLPVLVWNARRGWPTIAHQLGRVGAPGGDEPISSDWSPFFGLEFTAAQLALLGVFGAFLIGYAIRWAWRRRRQHPCEWEGHLLLICAAAPILVFYFVLGILKHAQGNWALGGYATLLVLVGLAASEKMPDYRARLRAWRALPKPRPRVGILMAKPETHFQIAWHGYLGVGLAAGVVMFVGPSLMRLPGVRDIPAATRVADRVSGHTRWVEPVAQALAAAGAADGSADPRPPLIVCDRYQKASLLAFYLPGQPRTFSAVSYLGGRRSPYDFFPDTDLADPDLIGRDVLFIGATPQRWRDAFVMDTIKPLRDGQPTIFYATGFGGPRPDAPSAPDQGGTP